MYCGLAKIDITDNFQVKVRKYVGKEVRNIHGEFEDIHNGLSHVAMAPEDTKESDDDNIFVHSPL